MKENKEINRGKGENNNSSKDIMNNFSIGLE